MQFILVFIALAAVTLIFRITNKHVSKRPIFYLDKDLNESEYPNYYMYYGDDEEENVYYRHRLTGEYVLLKKSGTLYKKVKSKINEKV